MLKLLTDKEKKRVGHEYVLRKTIVVLLSLSVVLVVGITSLSPAYVLSSARLKEAEQRMRVLEQAGVIQDTTEAEAWLADVNEKLKALDPKLDTDRPSDVIGQILEQRVAGINITNFSWSKVKNKPTVNVSGIAQNRQILIDFRDRITASNRFTDVELPVSNLAQGEDISFQIKLSPVVEKPKPDTP